MSVSIIIGGQYGSEGKGKVAFHFAKKQNARAVVRVGGSNSGHTVYSDDGKKYMFRMLPTASLIDNTVAVLPAGAYIDIEVLMHEIGMIGLGPDRLKIDPNAVIITKEHQSQEAGNGMRDRIGSTLSGTGAAVAARAGRRMVELARDRAELRPFLTDTKLYLRELLDKGEHIVIEGTQGYGLSNYHAKAYPYATGRDTTAAGFLAETGLSPFDVEHVVMVIRAFPIRVAGNSGPLSDETDWKSVSEQSGADFYFEEKTTVTHKTRRVARFSPEIVREAITANNPDIIVMNHVDYIDYSHRNTDSLSELQMDFVRRAEKEISRKINYLGNGEMMLISRREEQPFLIDSRTDQENTNEEN